MNSPVERHTWDKSSVYWGFPGGPVVKNLPANAVGSGSIPGGGSKIPHAMGQLNHSY